MSEISRRALFGKLDAVAYRAIEASTTFCRLRGNPYVELVHWIHQILQLPDSDLQRAVRRFELDAGKLARDMTAALDRLPRGATSVADLSTHVDEAVERGWVYGSLMFGATRITTGHLLVGILKTPTLRGLLHAMSGEFARIRHDALVEEFVRITAGSPEQAADRAGGSTATGYDEAGVAMTPAGGDALQRYTIDLTAQARAGRLDPIVGRNEQIRQVIDILLRRRQNNPILTGEAGVGKTAVVEGFAQRVGAGDVPPALKEVRVLALDVGLLQAGAGMKGEFEDRLRQVIDEVQAATRPVILFIDEAHTLIGAGGAAGTGDAANLLKPALARGTLRTIAATTWAEYKRHIEKDPALTRRFQVVAVREPTEDEAIVMMRGVASTMERHHRVQVLDEALDAAVRLSHRYIPARQLPDKAVSLLDTACARVAVSQHATPAAVDDARNAIASLQTELEIIGRERAIGIDTADRAQVTAQRLVAERARLAALESRWAVEKRLVERILGLRARLRTEAGRVDDPAHGAPAPSGDETSSAALRAELRALQSDLAREQGEDPLILPTVDRQAVASIVQDWTGVPVGRMVRDDVQSVLRLADALSQRIIGQRHALEMIARRIQTARAGLDDPRKPVGVFLLAGTSGVGKTETALALADALYGGEQNLITINMSEYQEAHTVSSLKGAPPGYAGYGEGGVLTEAVRRRPYSVVLLDEVEKAHPDVHELFFQVFDKGWMEDGEGRAIDFRNTLILLTTNVGTELIARMCRDPQRVPDPDDIAKAIRAPLLQVFPPALLGRLVTIPYDPLDDAMLGAIIRLQLGRVARRVEIGRGIPFSYGDDVVSLIGSRCTEVESGGRMIDAILTNSVLPSISRELLQRSMDGRPATRVHLQVVDGDFDYAFDGTAA